LAGLIQINAFITVTADQALAAAHLAENEIMTGAYRGPLHGVPISVNLFLTRGPYDRRFARAHRFCAGPRCVGGDETPEAGAVPIGKRIS
jgi:hypothetical protein